jgi:TPP-dependent pyruvate/acetoin dehydrogenase alpha subunit
VDVRHGVMGTSAVVGTTIPNAVGYAYALKFQRKDTIVACFFGDGAVEEGVFHESMNFAALKELPIIFICENNRYAIHSAQWTRQPADNLVERMHTYGMPAARIEHSDVLEIYQRVSKAAQAIRAKQAGPLFFECMTYRWREHVGPNEDFHLGYRPQREAEPWIRNDQVRRLAALVEAPARRQIDSEVEYEIQQAFAFAEASPFPDASELYTDLFKAT